MIEYKSNLAEMVLGFEKLDIELQKALKQGMYAGAWRFVRHLQQRQMSGRPGLRTITGQLKGSWYAKHMAGRGADYGVEIGTRSKYAAIHQFGGVIRPKNKPFLAFKPMLGIRTLSKSGSPLKRAKREWGAWVFTKKSVTIPKRLHVLEYFQSAGYTVISRAMWQNVASVLKMRKMQGASPNISL